MLIGLTRKKTFQTLLKRVRECVLVEVRHIQDADICTMFMKSALASKGFCPVLSDYDRSRSRTNISETV